MFSTAITVAPARRAASAVPSFEAASTTTISAGAGTCCAASTLGTASFVPAAVKESRPTALATPKSATWTVPLPVRG